MESDPILGVGHASTTRDRHEDCESDGINSPRSFYPSSVHRVLKGKIKLKTAIKNAIEKFLDPVGILERALCSDQLWVSIPLGVVGLFSFSLLSAGVRFYHGRVLSWEIGRLVVWSLPTALILFFGFAIVAYFCGRILRGNKCLRKSIIATGWGGLYALCLCGLYLPITTLGLSRALPPTIRLVTNLVFVVLVLFSLRLIFLWAKYHVRTIRELFGFGNLRALTVWGLATLFTLPFFILTTKLSDEEMVEAGLQDQSGVNIPLSSSPVK